MDIKYLNLEFWFYQIYLLFKGVINLFLVGPGAVTSVFTSAVFSLLTLALLGLILGLLYFYGGLSLPALIALGVLSFLLYSLFKILGISYLLPAALLGLTSLFLYGSGAIGLPALLAVGFLSLFGGLIASLFKLLGISYLTPFALLGLLSLFLYGSGAMSLPAVLVLGTFALLLYYLYIFGNIYLVLAFAFFGLLAYSLYKIKKLREKEEEDFLSAFAIATDPKAEEAEEWLDIIDHIDSENESQWKLALIDADKILENLLRENGYIGDGVGGMLKTAELQGGIKSLQDAWEAHKIRNRIAHETGFVLTKREARRAIELYKNVFGELGFL